MRSTAPHSPSQTPASMGSGLGLLLAGRACDPADRRWLAALKGATWHPDERELEGGDCHGGAETRLDGTHSPRQEGPERQKVRG